MKKEDSNYFDSELNKFEETMILDKSNYSN